MTAKCLRGFFYSFSDLYCFLAADDASCLDAESMEKVVKIIEKSLEEHFNREEERARKQGDEDFDEVRLLPCLSVYSQALACF